MTLTPYPAAATPNSVATAFNNLIFVETSICRSQF